MRQKDLRFQAYRLQLAMQKTRWVMLHQFIIALFALGAGFTASGIVANLYRLCAGKKPEGSTARTLYVAVMVFAGPCVLLENAAKSRRRKSCSGGAFWMVTCLASYWSFAIGLLVIEIGLSLV
jgi:hypothetical protein